MSVVTDKKTVTSAGTTQLYANPSGTDDSQTVSVLCKNRTGTASLLLDGVTPVGSTSYEWEADEGPVTIPLEPNEAIYAKSMGADQEVHILRVGR